MFGIPIFELEANDEALEHISEMNIRSDIAAFKLMDKKKINH